MKKFYFAFALCATLLSCEKAELLEECKLPKAQGSQMTVEVSNEEDKTALELSEGTSIIWNETDEISVLDGVSNNKFTIDSIGNSGRYARFKGSAATGKSRYYAVYPYKEDSLKDNSKMFYYNRVLPGASGNPDTLLVFTGFSQKPAPGKFDASAFLMLSDTTADSQGKLDFKMKNLCGLLKINLSASYNVTEIQLSGKNGEKLAGLALVVMDNHIPKIVSFAYDLIMGKIVATPASGTVFADGDYYLCVPPQTFSNGLEISFKRSDGKWTTRSTGDEFTIERGHIKSIDPKLSNATWLEAVDYEFSTAPRAQINWPFNRYFSETAAYSLHSDEKRKDIILDTKLDYLPSFGDYSVKVNSSKTFSPHPLNGVRIQNSSISENSYIVFPPLKNRKIVKMTLTVHNSGKVTLFKNSATGSTQIGSQHVFSSGTRTTKTVKFSDSNAFNEGDSLKLRMDGDVNICAVRVYFSEPTGSAPEFRSFEQVITGAIRDYFCPQNAHWSIHPTAKRDTLMCDLKAYGGVQLTTNDNFEAGSLSYGMEYSTSSTGPWNSVASEDLTPAIVKYSSYYYIHFSALMRHCFVGTSGSRTYHYRAWARNEDGSRTYGKTQSVYVSNKIFDINFAMSNITYHKTNKDYSYSFLQKFTTYNDKNAYGNLLTKEGQEWGSSTYTFDVCGQFGLCRGTDGGGRAETSLILSPYSADLEKGGTGNSWIKIPCPAGKTLSTVKIKFKTGVDGTVSLKIGTTPNSTTAACDDASPKASATVTTKTTTTYYSKELTATGAVQGTSYYLFVEPADGVYAITVTNLLITYK